MLGNGIADVHGNDLPVGSFGLRQLVFGSVYMKMETCINHGKAAEDLDLSNLADVRRAADRAS